MQPSNSIVYLIPSFLHDDGKQVISAYTLPYIEACAILFVENERTARRFIKSCLPQFDIDKRIWITIHKQENEAIIEFEKAIKQQLTIGIISESGCPGIADPGQILVQIAHQLQIKVKPLVGPNSITLALMASGLNGQSFQFVGYIPVDNLARKAKLKELENYSRKNNCTQICIETPYRNQTLFDEMLKSFQPYTKICVAQNLTASTSESIITNTVLAWQKKPPTLGKEVCIFLFLAT